MSGKQRKKILDGLYDLLITSYNNNVFSAAVLSFNVPRLLCPGSDTVCCGTTGIENDEKVTPATLFDLASLTKPLVTALSALFLVDQKKLAWNDLLGSLLDRAVPGPFKNIDLFSLMNHSSGLAAHRNFWKDAIRKDEESRIEWFLEELLNQEVQYNKGSRHIYSDLGYILLGFIIEKKTGKRLDHFWSEIVAEPLGIEKELFFPGLDFGMCKTSTVQPRPFAETGVCGWSGIPLKGIVHDDNCRSIGGICGHAGLFGSAPAVLVLCREMLALYKGKPNRLPIKSETFRTASRQVGLSDWTAGFNLPSRQGSSAGDFFSPDSIGHLGFTGTSFWIDLQRDLVVVLLTNRVVTGESMEGIQALRPAVHNYLAG